MSDHQVPPEVQALLDSFVTNSTQLNALNPGDDRPIYGTTLYLATCKLEMRFGHFTAYIFQDLVHKGHIIALAYGDIHSGKTLYTRVHSSCVTSETLRGCDCDCVQQLEGALQCITKKGAGILFYLIQEGRGVGYVAKARDRMLVQAANDTISTFKAYNLLGLRRDYRQYRNVIPILKMLDVRSDFVLMTNNPDKVSTMTQLGLPIKSVEPLEYEPGPYNVAYLTSKMEEGHILEKPATTKVQRIQVPEQVIPFKPYALKEAKRFIYTASYCLPISPVDDQIVIPEDLFKKIFADSTIESIIELPNSPIASFKRLPKYRYQINLNHNNLKAFADKNPDSPINQLAPQPYWFRVHVYFDITSGQDFVVLTHGHPDGDEAPVVRLQSESVFDRFPLTDTDDKDKFKATLNHIMYHGYGVIVHFYHDGRGAGIGAHAEDLMFHQLGFTVTTQESYQKLKVSYDSRDYDAAITLLKHHLPSNQVQMVVNSPSSLVKKTEYANALNTQNIDVINWIFLETDPHKKDHHES